MCFTSLGKKSISVILMPLIEWNRTAATRPELQQPHEGVLVGRDDPVVGVGAPADDRGVHHVGEQEQDDGDPGHPVEQPGPLPRVPLVDGAVVVLLLARPVATSSIALNLSRRPRHVRCPTVQQTARSLSAPRARGAYPLRGARSRDHTCRRAAMTPSRIGRIDEMNRSSAAISALCSRIASVTASGGSPSAGDPARPQDVVAEVEPANPDPLPRRPPGVRVAVLVDVVSRRRRTGRRWRRAPRRRRPRDSARGPTGPRA